VSEEESIKGTRSE